MAKSIVEIGLCLTWYIMIYGIYMYLLSMPDCWVDYQTLLKLNFIFDGSMCDISIKNYVWDIYWRVFVKEIYERSKIPQNFFSR